MSAVPPHGAPLGAWSPESVSVLMPVGPGTSLAQVALAVGSIAAQTLPPAALIVVANGVPDVEHDALEEWLARAELGCPTRLERLSAPNLAAALNHGMRVATTRLVARMDADDWSFPRRLETQAHLLGVDGSLAGVGCAGEVVGADGSRRSVMRPPADPGRLAWTLLLGNVLAHGSMVLRRDAVLDAGGYDPGLERAQDYDLWLRMIRSGHRLGAAPQTLYRYRERQEAGVASSSSRQAEVAARVMIGSWSALPPADAGSLEALARMVGDSLQAEHGGDAPGRIGSLLDAGATREGLLALLWSRDRFPALPRRAIEACRRSRVREVGAGLRARGVDRVWLWGAGQHTSWLLGCADELGVAIGGVVDDDPAERTVIGHTVRHPGSIAPGEHALLSSDWHEDAMWLSSAPHRARGVVVWRLYGAP